MELGNAGLNDPTYYRRRIRYCREFLRLFSEVDWQVRGTFLRAEAESCWRMDKIETAEQKFEALPQANPDWAWGYIGWSDQYWLCQDSPKDYDRGQAILQRALERPDLEDRDVVLERLKKLRTEQAKS
jgi:hypothetical protein